MAENRLPDKISALFTLADDMIDGLHTHEVAVGIKQNTEAAMQPLLDDCRSKQADFTTAKQTKVNKTGVQTVKDSNGKAFIGTARNVLVPSLGELWSTAWEPTGFPNQSTAVPSTLAERQALLNSLKLYFTANPAKENAPLGITAAIAATRYNELSTARSDANQSVTDLGDAKKARNAAETKLRKAMRGLIGELDELLEGDDPLWFAFGLVPPDGEDQPDQPTGLVLSGGASGSVLADWGDASRATGYRVETQIVGVDPAFHLFMSVSDSDATLSGLPGGATLKVRIIATNDQGDQSPASDEAQIVVPGPAVPPLNIQGSWNVGLIAASITWLAQSNPAVVNIVVRGNSGSTFNPATATVAGTVAPNATGVTTNQHLPTSGSVATFVAFEILSGGGEVASNPVTITRP